MDLLDCEVLWASWNFVASKCCAINHPVSWRSENLFCSKWDWMSSLWSSLLLCSSGCWWRSIDHASVNGWRKDASSYDSCNQYCGMIESCCLVDSDLKIQQPESRSKRVSWSAMLEIWEKRVIQVCCSSPAENYMLICRSVVVVE